MLKGVWFVQWFSSKEPGQITVSSFVHPRTVALNSSDSNKAYLQCSINGKKTYRGCFIDKDGYFQKYYYYKDGIYNNDIRDIRGGICKVEPPKMVENSVLLHLIDTLISQSEERADSVKVPNMERFNMKKVNERYGKFEDRHRNKTMQPNDSELLKFFNLFLEVLWWTQESDKNDEKLKQEIESNPGRYIKPPPYDAELLKIIKPEYVDKFVKENSLRKIKRIANNGESKQTNNNPSSPSSNNFFSVNGPKESEKSGNESEKPEKGPKTKVFRVSEALNNSTSCCIS